MDDKLIQGEQKAMFDLVHSDGWSHARGKIIEKILELQNVAEYIDVIQTGNATKLLKEMKANKRCAEILYGWLAEIEGTAQQAVEEKPQLKSYIVRQ